MTEFIEAVRDALALLAYGDGIQPLRPIVWLSEQVGALGTVPGYHRPRSCKNHLVVLGRDGSRRSC